MLLSKTKLNIIEISLSKALIDSNISHDEFVLLNNVLNRYDEMKKEIKLPIIWNESVFESLI